MLIKKLNYKNTNELSIKKSTLEWLGLCFLIIFSFINTTTLLISLVLLLTLLKQREIGAIKIINIITFRTIINPSIAVNIGYLQNLKWIILFGCSLYLLISYFKLKENELKKVNSIMILVILFTLYNIIIAFVFSSLPIIAVFKVFSYSLIFIGVLIGILYTFKKINWLSWMLNLLSIVILPSSIFIFIPNGYLVNGSFQGITNHPNLFGILAVLFLGLVFSNIQINKSVNKLYLMVIPPITMFLVILSESRTALISSLILILLYIIFSNIKIIPKIILLSFSSLLVILLSFMSEIAEFFTSYMYKSQEQGNLLVSRLGQIENLSVNFFNNPWFGNGFMVPVLPYKSYEFSSEFIVEPGNIILSVLSYSGIIGFIIFLMYLFKIFWVNKHNMKKVIFLPIAILFINMGEVVFFSSNNIGIWCYMFLALYMVAGNGAISDDRSIRR